LGYDEIRINIKYVAPKTSNEVLEIARRFKNKNEIDENIVENDILNPNILIFKDNLYIRFKSFILDNSDGDKIPSRLNIENSLGIDSNKRKELYKKAQIDGLLIRKNATTNILNINYVEDEEEEREKRSH
jgi:hypothetical protein